MVQDCINTVDEYCLNQWRSRWHRCPGCVVRSANVSLSNFYQNISSPSNLAIRSDALTRLLFPRFEVTQHHDHAKVSFLPWRVECLGTLGNHVNICNWKRVRAFRLYESRFVLCGILAPQTRSASAASPMTTQAVRSGGTDHQNDKTKQRSEHPSLCIRAIKLGE